MQFTSLTFLFVFLPILIAVYYLVKPECRQVVLLMMSIVFYACGSCAYIVHLCVSVFINFGIASGISICNKKDSRAISKLLLILGVFWNVSVLSYFKYPTFFIGIINSVTGLCVEEKNILVPLGISFFTFKAISFIVDVYTKKIEKVSALDTFTYLSFFAQIQSGPISRYCVYMQARDFSFNAISAGVVRFMIGFSKKVILADVLSNITCEIFDSTKIYSTGLMWLGSICYSLQLYYDFSGYSDMAIGIGNILGIKCLENFDYPYITKSVSEFWRRWHISLGNWFRDYVYIPLGGARVGKKRLYINLFVVWFLTGLWHGNGWNFIAWGVGYFVLISIEKTLNLPNCINNKIIGGCYRLIVLLFINFQWVLFRSQNLRNGLKFIKSMIIYTPDTVGAKRAMFLLKDYWIFIFFSVVLATPLFKLIEKRISDGKEKIGKAYDVFMAVAVCCLFIAAISFVVSGQNSPFLYGNF